MAMAMAMLDTEPPESRDISPDRIHEEGRTNEREEERRHTLIIQCIRALIADLCQQFDGGHPGGAMGMAAIGLCLWKYKMRYSPQHPNWFNRDRFVLSNGHACLLQYIFMYLTGYEGMTLDELKTYQRGHADSLCPGHPEIQHDGIEVTTGPLGQGIANAVGLAMASKHLAATYNRPGFNVIDNTIWCMVGDGCLQEGVALESISLAGHWKLDNLIVIHDNNGISSDGSIELVSCDDINLKFEACGWQTVTIQNASSDVAAILEGLQATQQYRRKPLFVNALTVIGADSVIANTRTAHGTPLGVEEVRRLKKSYGFDPALRFIVPDEVLRYFSDLGPQGSRIFEEWQQMFSGYVQEYPEAGKELDQRIAGHLPATWSTQIPNQHPSSMMSTGQSAGMIFQPIAERIKVFMVGTADLDSSVNLGWIEKTDFQRPSSSIDLSNRGAYAGRYIHWGVREHAMMAISNGIAAFNPGTIIPVTSTFLMFTLYGAPAIRMGALQQLQVIHVATHDSIGIGVDGPTHQPIEVAAFFRAMPNMLYMRPADGNETAGAWKVAIESKKTPSTISLSAQAVPQYPGMTRADQVSKGAYVLVDDDQADLTLLGVGAELSLAVATKDLLKEEGTRARLVSFPCHRLFQMQPRHYQRNVLQRHNGIPAIAIEAYDATGWERYADASISMSSFGKSLSHPEIYSYFGFDVPQITRKIQAFMARWRKGEVLRGDFEVL